MALTGQTVQSTYLDLVQLEQSGAGLPSHAGKEAALYDGSGAQILGRTAKWHHQDGDPDNDVADGTFDFAVDQNQTALESTGWTFSNCTASVTRGILKLESTDPGNVRPWAYWNFATALSGDFDFIAQFYADYQYDPGVDGGRWIFGVADTGNDYCYGMYNQFDDDRPTGRLVYTADYDGWTGLTYGTARTTFLSPSIHRLMRSSGTIYGSIGAAGLSTLFNAGGRSDASVAGWYNSAAVADARTFDQFFVTCLGNTPYDVGVAFVKRFA